MKSNILQLVVDTDMTILTSKSLFYKTENFIKKTKNVSNIDSLLSKLCETIMLNIDDIMQNENKFDRSAFNITTGDKNYSFYFKFGYQIGASLNPQDIILYDYIGGVEQFNIRADEYVKLNPNVKVIIKKVANSTNYKDFTKLYLISNVSGVNLPRLDHTQKEIVETIDKNILVQGVAGSGKTNICIDKIIFTACKNFTGKVLYTTFSRGLLIDTKLKVEGYKKDLIEVLENSKNNKIKFLDSDHKKALENKLGISFFSDDDNQIFKKIEKVLDYLNNKVDYYLIEDLYNNKFGGEHSFVNEQYFIEEYAKNLSNHQIQKCFSKLSNFSKEIIYKEIFGMIMGSYSLSDKKDILSLEEYVLKRENSFSRQECETIYQVALDYKKHLERNNLLDNNLASKQIIDSTNDFEYSLAIIDEVQDYTQANLCLFKKLSLKMFCVGDALQMINPSYFNFGYLKNLLYEKDLVDVKELKSNYRNTKKITEIIDNLDAINKQEFGTHNFVVKGESVDSGLTTKAIFIRDNSFLKSISVSGYEDLTFVVANEKIKKELLKIIKSQEVLTVSEIKGLERTNVIAYDILSSNVDKWNTLKRNKVNHKLADENSVFRYYYNLFYVSLSRAKQNLFVCESLVVDQFENFLLKNFEKRNAKETINLLSQIVSKAEFSQLELIARVNEFIKLEQFDNARITANKIREDKKRIEAMRNIEVYSDFIRHGKYRDAGIKFWEYGMIPEAKQQFTLSGDTILIELIDKCASNSNGDLNIDIVTYFEDVKDNNIAQAFIVDTVKKDIKNLKNSFYKIQENFKKGRK